MATESNEPTTKKKKPAAAPSANGSQSLLLVLKAAADGDYATRVDLKGLSGEAREMGSIVNQLLSRVGTEQKSFAARGEEMQHLLESAQAALSALVSHGDLTNFQWQPINDPVIDPLLDGFSKVIDTLRTFVREINEAALRLSSSANEVLAASTQHESSSTEQAAAIHETTATMEELKHASAQIAENAGAVARVAEETLNSARSGRGAIGEFIEAMQQIRADGIAVSESITKLLRRVERIGTVVEVIDEIADRSDLLALNAALEGSRAGEAGKGFSIVAAEMRRLAENVLDSTKEIKNLITEIREATAAAASAADASRTATEQGERLGSVAASAVEGILAGVQETSDAARVINLATQQQRTATEQVVASMAEIEDVTRQTTQASKQATSAAAELTQLASRLSDLIKRFKAD
ncbi:MAG: Frizzy aggregation protein FrzCD [Archangium gephyra]|uniref:Frizzy aggregation protein FrzCD n=1 Tax=Archangium gephyra TaxID=48 RepID=A0A2W5TNY0_9BACT|nr:MAG: Frizzy aggregation protein FrzCD [Archangium gephyra]